MKIYVAAPFENGPIVRELHERLSSLGHEPVGRWVAEAGGGKDGLHRLSISKISSLLDTNDEDVVSSDVLVALVTPGMGKEMFCEAALARLLRKPVIWVGREEWLPLSAFRPGAWRTESIATLMSMLKDLATTDGVERLWVSFRQL